MRDRAALRAELGVAPRAFLAVLVAALRPEKRATAFVEQVTAAHAAEPSIPGLVVGDGPDAAAVARAAEHSGGVVRMTGYRADALDVMHAADVVCLTSAVEALPMSVLEAMSVARPVIATDVGDVREVVPTARRARDRTRPARPRWPGALVRSRATAARAAALGRAGRVRQRERLLDRGDDRGLRRAPGGGGTMRPPHVVVVNQDAPRPTKPLRVAVLVESLTVPEWVKWTLEQLDALAGCDLAAVVPSAGASDRPAVPRDFRHLTYRLYERADARVFGSAPALEPADVSWIAAGRTGLAGIDALDVVVSFLPVERTAWAGPIPRHGLWAIVPMDDGRTAAAPDRFWELQPWE